MMIPLKFRLIALGILAAGAFFMGWRYVSTIEQNKRLSESLKLEKSISDFYRGRVAEEIAISKNVNTLTKEVFHAPDHDGCRNPVILRDTVRRLHGLAGAEGE